ncbi:hypothetical protein BBJ28_00025136 [Nothophytophthora sp. Chile5]|nr:hypothetical protein BBJ28_00025136 [Nothophytophthora sp. Chile5]
MRMHLAIPQCLYVGVAVLVAAASKVAAVNDYLSLRQPTLLQSDCATRWSELSSSTTSASSSDTSALDSSDAGEFHVNLSAQVARFESDYVNFNTRTYNGQVPAPTIKVCPGDRLVITLTNGLEAGSDNNTNLHLHGMHLPPVGNADNVMPNVEPGDQRVYTYDIGSEHPAGTFWYHPHSHGNVNSQLNGMMAGTLIVADRPTAFPVEVAAMDDLVLLLQAICVENCHNIFDNLDDAVRNDVGLANGDDDGEAWDVDFEVVEDEADAPLNDTSLPTVYVNGQILPKIEIAVSEYKRLRFVNAIANNVAELVTTNGSGCNLHVLAMDGIYFDAPKVRDVVVLPPGGRADVAIMCSEDGTFYIETDSAPCRNKLLGKVNQHRVPSQRIVKLKVLSDEGGSGSVAMRLPSTLPARPSYLVDTVGSASASAVADSTIPERNKYGFEFSVWMDPGTKYGVNHEKLNVSHVNHTMPVGELQRWELSVNTYDTAACDVGETSDSDCRTMNHPFHIHSTHFQVSDMDVDADPDGVMFELGEWRDTLPLFRASVQIRFTPRDYMVGNIFAHCHIASHVDGGMAQLVGVYDTVTSGSDESEDENEEDESGSEIAEEADAEEDEDEAEDEDEDEDEDEEE